MGVQVPLWVVQFVYHITFSFHNDDRKGIIKWLEEYAAVGQASCLFDLFFSSFELSTSRLEFIQRSPHAQTKYGFHAGLTLATQRIYFRTDDKRLVTYFFESLPKLFSVHNVAIYRC